MSQVAVIHSCCSHPRAAAHPAPLLPRSNQGYRYNLYRQRVVANDGPGSPIIPLASTPTIPTSSSRVTVTINLNYTNFGQWTLEVEPANGDLPWWWGVVLAFLLLAAVLVGCFLLSAMIANTMHRCDCGGDVGVGRAGREGCTQPAHARSLTQRPQPRRDILLALVPETVSA